MILAAGDEITPAQLPKDIRDQARLGGGERIESLAEIEAAHIGRVLRATRGNVKLAAQRLGISRSTLYAKMQKFALSPEPDGTPASGSAAGPTVR
ncbi:MAG: hypothetical protein B7X11_01975 [Acidobacteria bacterium 37-65-4]|nr:MAG: hypothetical protein B7X11_01975 [Acidobacteria bacterium 37-65-4]